MKKVNKNSFKKYIKFNKENCIKSNNTQGITLIALIVTIVVMIVVAGVTINMTIGENGIFTKAVKAKEMQEAAEVKERLELKQLDARLASGGGSITLEEYLKYLVDQGMIDESDIEDTEDSNVKTILVDDKYMYTVVKKDDGTIELEYEGKAGKLLPKIKSVNTKSTTSSIEVKVDATRVDGGEYRFYIKDVTSGEDYKKKGTNKTGEYTFTGLEQNKEFRVKVEVENKNGIAEKETNIIRTVTVAELTQADLEFTYNPNEWTKDKIVVTVNAKIEIPTGYTLQTSKDMTKWDNTTTQEFTENGYMYVRLFDGTNGGSYAVGEVTKIDKDAPTITISSSNVDSNRFTLNATVQDTASGLQKIEWYYKKSTDTKYTKLEDGFSGETTSLTKTKEISSIPYAETYNAFARVYDVATNSKDSNVINITLTTAVAQIGNVGFSSLQNAVNAVPTNNTQTTITLLADTQEHIVIDANKNINLNLNGKTLRGKLDYEDTTITNFGTLNLYGGTVKSGIVNNRTDKWFGVLQNIGTLTVQDGTYINELENSILLYDSATATTIFNGGTYTNSGSVILMNGKLDILGKTEINSSQETAIVMQNGITNIKSGIVQGDFSAIWHEKGTINIEGGQIKGKEAIYEIGGNLNIKGGEIVGTNQGINLSNGILNVTSGKIQGINGDAIYKVEQGNANITVSAGEIIGSTSAIATVGEGTMQIKRRNNNWWNCERNIYLRQYNDDN